jgi:hypothetical protein
MALSLIVDGGIPDFYWIFYCWLLSPDITVISTELCTSLYQNKMLQFKVHMFLICLPRVRVRVCVCVCVCVASSADTWNNSKNGELERSNDSAAKLMHWRWQLVKLCRVAAGGKEKLAHHKRNYTKTRTFKLNDIYVRFEVFTAFLKWHILQELKSLENLWDQTFMKIKGKT